MKRGTPDHPKTKRLARTLGVPRPHAVGMLEMLWHFTARFSPNGDIGRFDPEDIAEAVDWERDPLELLNTLVDLGWLDRPGGDGSLLVHDWSDHADESVRKTLQRRGEDFADGTPARTARSRKPAPQKPQKKDDVRTASGHVPDMSRQCPQALPTKSASPEPEPLPEPEPQDAPAARAPATAPRWSQRQVRELITTYPRLDNPCNAVTAALAALDRLAADPPEDVDPAGVYDWLLDRVRKYADYTRSPSGDHHEVPTPAEWFGEQLYFGTHPIGGH